MSNINQSKLFTNATTRKDERLVEIIIIAPISVTQFINVHEAQVSYVLSRWLIGAVCVSAFPGSATQLTCVYLVICKGGKWLVFHKVTVMIWWVHMCFLL